MRIFVWGEDRFQLVFLVEVKIDAAFIAALSELSHQPRLADLSGPAYDHRLTIRAGFPFYQLKNCVSSQVITSFFRAESSITRFSLVFNSWFTRISINYRSFLHVFLHINATAPSHTTVRAVRHTAVQWTVESSCIQFCRELFLNCFLFPLRCMFPHIVFVIPLLPQHENQT